MDTMNDLLICAQRLGYETDVVKISMPSNWRYWYELNQYTGLKDKNGIEIYEGDIDNRTRIDYFESGSKGKWLGEYNPLTNDAQAMELLKWLIDQGFGAWQEKGKYICGSHFDDLLIEGQTLNEAIIKAVVAMEDTHERV